MADDQFKIDQEELIAFAKRAVYPIPVDTPFAFRYEAQKGSQHVEVPSIPVLGSHLMKVRLDLEPEAIKWLHHVLATIAANPGRDIEGRVEKQNAQ